MYEAQEHKGLNIKDFFLYFSQYQMKHNRDTDRKGINDRRQITFDYHVRDEACTRNSLKAFHLFQCVL